MNTGIRLLVLVPAAVLAIPIGLLGLGFGGLNVGQILIAIAIIGTPVGLIAWTIADDRKRRRALPETKRTN